jgi:hypothetical protein
MSIFLCCAHSPGERSHLRDKSDVRSNNREYLMDLYRHTARLGAKLAIVDNPRSHLARRVGANVSSSLQYDTVYRRILKLDPDAVDEVPTPVLQRQARDGDASAACRGALLAVARQFDMTEAIIEQLEGAQPIPVRYASAVRHVPFSASPLVSGSNVSYHLPGDDATTRASIGRVTDLFCALDEIWVGVACYAYRDAAPPAVDGAGAAAAATGAADAAAHGVASRTTMCRLTLRPHDYRILPLHAIANQALVQHEHCLPVGKEPFNVNVHCRLAMETVSGTSMLRRTALCEQNNVNYVLNLAVTEKRSVFKG